MTKLSLQFIIALVIDLSRSLRNITDWSEMFVSCILKRLKTARTTYLMSEWLCLIVDFNTSLKDMLDVIMSLTFPSEGSWVFFCTRYVPCSKCSKGKKEFFSIQPFAVNTSPVKPFILTYIFSFVWKSTCSLFYALFILDSFQGLKSCQCHCKTGM